LRRLSYCTPVTTNRAVTSAFALTPLVLVSGHCSKPLEEEWHSGGKFAYVM
jgi:hypothetical protein